MPFNVVLIGCGGIAGYAHGPSLQKYAALHPQIRLAACCDIDAQKAGEFAESFGFQKSYDDPWVMLDAEKPDAVFLCCPVTLTEEFSVRILKLGYPLMLEKPPGMNRQQTLNIIRAADETGTPHQVAFNRRFVPAVTELKRMLLENGQKIQNIGLTFSRAGRFDPDFSTTAIHGIDTVKFIAGADYDYVKFKYQKIEGNEELVNIYMDCTFQNGAFGQLAFTPLAGAYLELVTVNCRDHSYYCNIPFRETLEFPGGVSHYHKKQLAEKIGSEQLTDSLETFEVSGFYAEDVSFLEDIQNGVQPKNDARSGLQSVELIECIRRRDSEYCNLPQML